MVGSRRRKAIQRLVYALVAVSVWTSFARAVGGPIESGSGIIGVEIEPKSGRVTGVRMVKTTGNRVLDRAAIETFRKARFKPGTARYREIPISYQLRSDQ